MARIVFVTSRVPYPPVEGHQLRAWHLLRAAAGRHRVSLVSLRRPEDPSEPPAELTEGLESCQLVDLPELASNRERLRLGLGALATGRGLMAVRYNPPALGAALRAHTASADLVHLDILAVAASMRRLPAGLPVVLDEHNVEHRLASSRIQTATDWPSRQMLRARAAGLRGFERWACQRASRVLSCSTVDAGHLRQLAPRADVRVVPNGVDLAAFQPDPEHAEQPDSLVFVGHMSWFPNRDGMDHFIGEILPRLSARPRLQLRVVGRNNGYAAPATLGPGVEFTGFVPDHRPVIAEAAVFIVPLRHGSGTRLKILEAMAMGKAIVTTRIGAEGIGLTHGHNALLADDPESFAAAIELLLDDPDRRARMGRAARELAERSYGWEAIGQELLAVYDEVLDRGASRAAPGTKQPTLPRRSLEAGE